MESDPQDLFDSNSYDEEEKEWLDQVLSSPKQAFVRAPSPELPSHLALPSVNKENRVVTPPARENEAVAVPLKEHRALRTPQHENKVSINSTSREAPRTVLALLQETNTPAGTPAAGVPKAKGMPHFELPMPALSSESAPPQEAKVASTSGPVALPTAATQIFYVPKAQLLQNLRRSQIYWIQKGVMGILLQGDLSTEPLQKTFFIQTGLFNPNESVRGLFSSEELRLIAQAGANANVFFTFTTDGLGRILEFSDGKCMYIQSHQMDFDPIQGAVRISEQNPMIP